MRILPVEKIKRKYQRLAESFRKKETCVFRYFNCLPCKHITKTIIIDAGIMPNQCPCEKCGEAANYLYGHIDNKVCETEKEWIRPELVDVIGWRRSSPEMVNYVLSGQLCIRENPLMCKK